MLSQQYYTSHKYAGTSNLGTDHVCHPTPSVLGRIDSSSSCPNTHEFYRIVEKSTSLEGNLVGGEERNYAEQFCSQ